MGGTLAAAGFATGLFAFRAGPRDGSLLALLGSGAVYGGIAVAFVGGRRLGHDNLLWRMTKRFPVQTVFALSLSLVVVYFARSAEWAAAAPWREPPRYAYRGLRAIGVTNRPAVVLTGVIAVPWVYLVGQLYLRFLWFLRDLLGAGPIVSTAEMALGMEDSDPADSSPSHPGDKGDPGMVSEKGAGE